MFGLNIYYFGMTVFLYILQAEMENDAPVQERSLVTGKSGYSQASTASIPSSHMDSEAIRHFNIPKDKLPLTYRLLRVKDLPAWANTSSVSIRDVIQVNISYFYFAIVNPF